MSVKGNLISRIATNPKLITLEIGFAITLTLSGVLGLTYTHNAYALAWTPDTSGDYEGQEPRYLTFKSMGECHRFVKDNPELGLSKHDCQKGTPPPSPSPEE